MDNTVYHSLEPVYDSNSRVLVLGTIPSPKSREAGFYYSHPQNRFWAVMPAVFGETIPNSIESKKDFLYRNKIALWDVLASCKIKNADDNSITEPVVNNFSQIFDVAGIKTVFTTGKKATALYAKHCSEYGFIPVYLPSTSPANCRMPFEALLGAYKQILLSTSPC